jgi:hydroxymethylbilane synthase
MNKEIRIGTRSSQLALWQANTVKHLLEKEGSKTQIIKIDGHGDQDLTKPLHQLGTVGLFTKNLDDAMLRGEIDIAVHSLKDVPTELHEDITQVAVLERGQHHDVLVYKGNTNFMQDASSDGTIATGSLRRKAQWLARYPNHKVVSLRGNVNTRLRKLDENNWLGAIFAQAGLNRIDLLPEKHIVLDWMIPAPAQGTVMVTALKSEVRIKKACAMLNHTATEMCVKIERDFMRTLEGGCTAPIGAKASISGNIITFNGGVYSLDGTESVLINKDSITDSYHEIGSAFATEVINNGGKKLMDEILNTIENEQN